MKTMEYSKLSGQTFGRWHVQDDVCTTERGERKWLCMCSCGTRRYVLERSLKSGGSLSCGCLRRDNAEKANTYDLTGRIFGRLVILRRAEEQRRAQGVRWVCRCECGKICAVTASRLMTGRRTHCGCEKNAYMCDIAGQRFGRITALYATKARDAKGSVIWHCRCDCGENVELSYNVLRYSEIRSCGCQKRRHNRALSGFLTHVSGTTLDILKSTKIPKNNTTGVKGVYLIKGKYVAKIVFQKKQYYLGGYATLEEAAQARREAEIAINETAVAYYERWKARAQKEPEWAKKYPVSLIIDRDARGKPVLICRPELENEKE